MRNLLVLGLTIALITLSSAALAEKTPDLHPAYSKGNLDCTGAISISCGDIVSGSNVGGVNNVDYYSCVAWLESGPEVVYELTLPGPECYEVTAEISGMILDLDVFILGSCEELDCLAYGNVSATTDCLEPGTYYIVVDGFDGAEDSYVLEVSCVECECPGPCPPEQNALPFYEDFEREECFPPAGWVWLNLGDDPADQGWEWADYNVCHGVGTARCYWATLFQDEWFVTPIIYLDGIDCLEISFQHYTSVWSYCTDPMEVLVSTTGIDPADFEVIWTLTCDEESFCDLVSLIVPLDPGSDHVYVAWRYQGTYAGAWYVDNISIDASGASASDPTSWGGIKALYR